MSNKVCDKDCLNCPYPDCINDELDHEDYMAERALEEFLRPKTARQKQIAAQQRAYREANREDHALRAIADRLRAWRREHGYTQTALARLCGLTQGAISQIENGMAPISAALRTLLETTMPPPERQPPRTARTAGENPPQNTVMIPQRS